MQVVIGHHIGWRRLRNSAACLLLAATGCNGNSDAAAASSDSMSVAARSMPSSSAGASALNAGAEGSAAGRGAPVSHQVGSAAAGSGGNGAAGAGVTSAGGAGVTSAGGAGVTSAGGAGVTSAGVTAGEMASSTPTLTQVYEMVYTTSCAACHSMTPSDNSNGMLGMIRSKDQLYAALVDKPTQGSLCAGKGTYIVPGKPELSVVIQKLSAAPSCGAAMPLGGMLLPEQVKLVRDWIAAGAINN